MKLTLLLTAVLAATATPAPPPDEAQADGSPSTNVDAALCGALPPAAADACGEAPLCSARERVRIACELRRALDERYVFLPVKASLLADQGSPGLDPRRHLDACVEAERAIATEDEPLRFYDRMRRCTAALEDGHLLLRVPGGLPQVALGLELRLAADGKVYVARREPRLAAVLAGTDATPDAAALLVPGAQVLEIDGRPVDDALAQLASYLPAGSRGARLERAVDALTRRDFAHPERRLASLTVATAGGPRQLVVPWWVAPGADRKPAARAWLRRTGIAATALLDWRAERRAGWSGAPGEEGVRRGDPIFAPAGAAPLAEYAGSRGVVAARLGEPSLPDGRGYCYAQFLSFHTETLSAGGAARPFREVVQEFLRGCNERGRDVVLDLRENEGGYLSHSTAIARMLLPADRTSPGAALLLRATDFNERVYLARAPARQPGDIAPGGGSGPQRVLDSIRSAREAREDFTGAFVDGPLLPAPEVGGFGGRVVVLVSPGCMSVCERLAGLVREGGNAVLVGGPTEGAGGSQQETRELPARWTDGEGRLSLSIPNAAMGVPRGSGAGEGTSAERFFGDLALENRPLQPDVRYATSLEDLTGHNRGWLEQVERALRRRGVAPLPGAIAAPLR